MFYAKLLCSSINFELSQKDLRCVYLQTQWLLFSYRHRFQRMQSRNYELVYS